MAPNTLNRVPHNAAVYLCRSNVRLHATQLFCRSRIFHLGFPPAYFLILYPFPAVPSRVIHLVPHCCRPTLIPPFVMRFFNASSPTAGRMFCSSSHGISSSFSAKIFVILSDAFISLSSHHCSPSSCATSISSLSRFFASSLLPSYSNSTTACSLGTTWRIMFTLSFVPFVVAITIFVLR